MSAHPMNGRRRWRPIAIALAIVAAAVIAILAYNGTRNQTNPDPTTAPTTSPSESPTTQGPDAAPTGCLGGPSRDADMLLLAVDDAPRTATGATEVAASFVRWIQRYPYPSEDEAELVTREVLADESFTSDLVQYLRDEPDLSGGVVPPGEEYWMSTVPGVWNVESATDDAVEVTIGTGFVLDGALSPMLRSSITVTAHWERGGWRISEADGVRTTEDLFAVGEPFIGGC